MGAAAARKVNSLAYALLTTTGSGGYGQTMTEDATVCFHANHTNYKASGAGAAPSVDTLNAAEALMMKQKAPVRSGETASAYLNIRPGHIIVPPELVGTAEVLMSAMFDPNGTTASRSLRDAPNRWKGRLTVTADPLATVNSGTAWWLAAPKGNTAIDTITVFFLEGQQGPYTEEAETIDFDGKVYKVRIDAVARALDFRGLFMNYGA
jgi:phage major head subunit gpT-like protein